MPSKSNRRLKKAAGWVILTTLVLIIVGIVVWMNIQFGFNPDHTRGAGQDWTTVLDVLLMLVGGIGVVAGIGAIVVCALKWVSA
jgi:hypothetical protein